MGSVFALRPLGRRGYASSAPELYDVVVVGAGMVGAAVAALLRMHPSTQDLRVALLNQQAPCTSLKLSDVPDLRVSTITAGSLTILKTAGAWEPLRGPRSAEFSTMQVWDSRAKGCIRWDSQELGQASMGWVVENNILQAALLRAALGHPAREDPLEAGAGSSTGSSTGVGSPPRPDPALDPLEVTKAYEGSLGGNGSNQQYAGGGHRGVDGLWPCSLESLVLPPYNLHQSPNPQGWAQNHLAEVHLQGGTTIRAKLVVGADGGNSLVRRLAGIRCEQWDYQQRGLVATVATREENLTAWQRFLPSGPLALLPVRGGFSNIVWSTTPAMVQELEQLGPLDFADALNRALRGPLGPHLPQFPSPLQALSPPPSKYQDPPEVLQWVGSPPRSFPLRLNHAGRYVTPRVALVGDAAHVIHPLAGQGVNLGLADAWDLVQAVAYGRERGVDIGDLVLLEEHYERSRRAANIQMIRILDLVKGLFAVQSSSVALLRGVGLDLLNAAPPVKNAIMSFAMGGGESVRAGAAS